jgi:hypothetical protein
MKLYDFSLYMRKRQAEQAVVETVSSIQKPGSVIQLKHHVRSWLALHHKVTKRSV